MNHGAKYHKQNINFTHSFGWNLKVEIRGLYTIYLLVFSLTDRMSFTNLLTQESRASFFPRPYKGKDTRLWNFSAAQRYYKENIVNPDIVISQGLLYSLWISLCRRKIPQARVFTLSQTPTPARLLVQQRTACFDFRDF